MWRAPPWYPHPRCTPRLAYLWKHLFYQRPFLSSSRFSWHRKYLKSEGRLNVHSSCCHIDGDNGGPPEGSVCRLVLLVVPRHLKCNVSKKEQRRVENTMGFGIVQPWWTESPRPTLEDGTGGRELPVPAPLLGWFLPKCSPHTLM